MRLSSDRSFRVVARAFFILASCAYLVLIVFEIYHIQGALQAGAICDQMDRINAAAAKLQDLTDPPIGKPMSLDSLVRDGLLDPSDAKKPPVGAIFCLPVLPPKGQPYAEYDNGTGANHRYYPILKPDWELAKADPNYRHED